MRECGGCGCVATQAGHHAGEDDDQAVCPGVDDTGLAQHLELLRRPRHGGLSVADSVLEQHSQHGVLLRRGRIGRRRVSAMWARRREIEWAISRKTVSIVPSAGSLTDS